MLVRACLSGDASICESSCSLQEVIILGRVLSATKTGRFDIYYHLVHFLTKGRALAFLKGLPGGSPCVSGIVAPYSFRTRSALAFFQKCVVPMRFF